MTKIKKGLRVKVLAGKDKKKEGEVIEIERKLNRVKIKGINIVKKHVKTTKEKKGGIIEKENLVERASETGSYLLNSIYNLQEEYPHLVSNARGRGLYCAFDLPSGEERDKLSELLLEEGSILLGSGHQSIRFRPHLNVEKEDIDFGMDCFKKALNKLG